MDTHNPYDPMNTINTPVDWSALGEEDDRPDMPPLHAVYLEVADRAQEVAWQAYVQDRRPSACVTPGTGVLDAYARLGTAVEHLLDVLAEGGQFTARWRDTRRVTVNFYGAHTLRIRAYREPNRLRRRLRIVLDSSDMWRDQWGERQLPCLEEAEKEARDEQS